MNRVSYSGQLIAVGNNFTKDTTKIAKAAGAQVVFESINRISRTRNAGACTANALMYVFVDADFQIGGPLLHAAVGAVAQGNKRYQ